MAALHSYELQGKKLSFANWISNLSPTETPFCSMTGKEAIDQVVFHWQTDRLAPAKENKNVEGSDINWEGGNVKITGTVANVEYIPVTDTAMNATSTYRNYAQILRKSFKVSDTANVMANYGRGREVAYQMEKFSLGIKRDLESILLSKQASADGAIDSIRKTAAYQSLIAPKRLTANTPATAFDPDTGACVHFETKANKLAIGDIQEMTYNLYLANSDANVIMFHPRYADFFARLVADGDTNKIKMFDGDEKTFSLYVNTYRDEFGRTYKLVPNRWMPMDALYFFNPSDFTQMVLRAPEKTQLAKTGNYEHWMIEMEVGLRLRDPFAAGALLIKP